MKKTCLGTLCPKLTDSIASNSYEPICWEGENYKYDQFYRSSGFYNSSSSTTWFKLS